MKKIYNYIDGKFVSPTNNKYIENFSPTNGECYSLVPDSNIDDVIFAVNAAKKAFSNWGKSTKEYRSKWLLKLADAIDSKSEELVRAESFDNGKPEWLAKTMDIPRCSANLRFFATSILHYDSKIHDMDGAALNYTLKQPIGVAGCISPWNLPLYLLTWKIAPAIATGNTVVAKPSEITPYTAYLFSKICNEIDFPKGVINIVHGSGKGVGEEIVKNTDIVSFTGGTKTGRSVAINAASNFKKFSLELGGKNPLIIFNDCNFELAVEGAIKSSFLNQGQICLCSSRILVESGVYSKFKAAFVKKTKALVVGSPKSSNSNLGAIVSKGHLENILKKIRLAVSLGGKLLCGGERVVLPPPMNSGYYLEPTIIEGLPNNCVINQEEIFGPVVSISAFHSEDEVVKISNNTKYGLAASIFSENISRCHRIASKIDCGIIWINSWLLRDLRIPFGGMKESGIGREGGRNSLDFFTETKNVCVKIKTENNK